jgi:hypothetical protein
MRNELDELLCKKYPKIFADRHGDMRTTAMCWGFDCGDGWFNIIDRLCENIQWRIDARKNDNARRQNYLDMVSAAHKGNWEPFNEYYTIWNPSPDLLEKYRQEVLNEPIPNHKQLLPEIPQVVATQVKEKYGTLRFYYYGGDDEISSMVTLAESMSEVTCEQCGNPGKTLGGEIWTSTLCKAHAEEANYNWENDWFDDENVEDEKENGDYLPFGQVENKE